MNVLWLQSGGCGGCSMSLLCADTADFPAMLKSGGIELLWHPSLSLASGRELITLLEDCRDGRTKLDVLCVEGSLLRGPNGTGRFHMLAGTGLPMIDWVRSLAAMATHVVAVGSCAAWGGITATGPNITDACGLQYDGDRPGGLLGADFVARGGLPVMSCHSGSSCAAFHWAKVISYCDRANGREIWTRRRGPSRSRNWNCSRTGWRPRSSSATGRPAGKAGAADLPDEASDAADAADAPSSADSSSVYRA